MSLLLNSIELARAKVVEIISEQNDHDCTSERYQELESSYQLYFKIFEGNQKELLNVQMSHRCLNTNQ